jgi:Fur family ferric uptake transcriptional regulator
MLADRQLKSTPKRMEILLYLQSQRKPKSAEEIHREVSKTLRHRAIEDTLDLVTVYRNLKQLTEVGCIQKSYFDEGRTQYALLESREHLHSHHIQCIKCEKIESVPVCLSIHHKKQFADLGYQAVSHRLEFYGVCSACK